MHPFCRPEIYEAVQREQVFANSPAEEQHIRSRMRHMLGTLTPEQINGPRQMMNIFKMYTICPRRACQRGGSCQTRLVTCMWENLEFVQKHVFPRFDELVRRRMLMDADIAAAAPAAGARGERFSQLEAEAKRPSRRTKKP